METPRESDPFTLAPFRVHEAEGTGRRAFALFQAARVPGVIVWIAPAHLPEQLMPRGLPQGVAERLNLIRTGHERDLLWSVEECLRAVPVALVVAEPDQPLSLTAGRRLQLAAESGRTTGLMLLRAPGSNAAETRWACRPHPSPQPDSTWHLWSVIKNKKGTTADWRVNWNGTSAAFDLVATPRQRDEPSASSR